jgi:hypothetical protein
MSLDRRFTRRVYNTPVGGSWDFEPHRLKIESEDGDVLRCPECSAEIDVDEDEVEEGEILSCPECECELEVSQTHPVALNPISDDLDEEEDDEEEDEEDAEDDDEFDENGDLLEDEDDEDEAEDDDE